jgi:hypothetical protein
MKHPSGPREIGSSDSAAQGTVHRTPFPTSPSNVVALTVPEFACGLALNQFASIDAVCQLFLDDTNQALVWLIRFRALAAWRERADMAAWLQAEPTLARHGVRWPRASNSMPIGSSTPNRSAGRLNRSPADSAERRPRGETRRRATFIVGSDLNSVHSTRSRETADPGTTDSVLQ